MTLFVYISMENPREYMDCDMESVFSQKAYGLVVSEKLESKQTFWIVNVALMNERLVRTKYGNSELAHILEHIAKAMSSYTGEDAYHSHRRMVAVILHDKKECEQLLLDGLVEAIQKELVVDHEMADLRLTVLECPTYVTTYLGVEYIEVNLSGKQIVDKYLPEQLLACMKQYALAPNCINLEITETAAVEAEEILEQNMKRLQDAGFGFSMDDFGTGYSNLSKMEEVGFDLIKLDKSLIWPCFEEDSEGAKVILNSCVDMIHRLGRHIVAEGVETQEQADMLTEKGVAYLQGYYYSRPLPENQYLEFMEKAAK